MTAAAAAGLGNLTAAAAAAGMPLHAALGRQDAALPGNGGRGLHIVTCRGSERLSDNHSFQL